MLEYLEYNKEEPSAEALFMTLMKLLSGQLSRLRMFKKILAMAIIILGLLIVAVASFLVQSLPSFFLIVIIVIVMLFLGRLCWPSEKSL